MTGQAKNKNFLEILDFFKFLAYAVCMKQTQKKSGNRRGTGPASRFSQLLNEELRAIVARQRLSLRMLEEMTGVSRTRLSHTLNQDMSPLNTNEFELICQALEVSPAEICTRAEAARKKEAAEAELASLTDAQLAAQILARAEAATKAGYRLAAHPADKVITDDGNWTA